MQPGNRHFLDIVKQESLLPQINANACLHALYDQSECQTCVDSCPSEAWVLGDESLGLDTEICDGCGLCVPTCPSGALYIHFPWVIRSFGGQMIALFSCDKSSIAEKAPRIPCIHALGLRQLLLMYQSGIRHLLVSTAECRNCTRNPDYGIHQRVEQLNRLLCERNGEPVKILQRSVQVWKRIFNTDELISRGTQLPRREFLRGGGRLLRSQLLVLDPLNLSESRSIPPGGLLPAANDVELHWPWAPRIHAHQCNGCDACIKLCPTDALQMVNGEAAGPAKYMLNPATCTGCGICENVCESQAISVNSHVLSKAHTIELVEHKCTACGNDFHYPRRADSSEQKLCRICLERNHSNKLFQVLSDE